MEGEGNEKSPREESAATNGVPVAVEKNELDSQQSHGNRQEDNSKIIEPKQDGQEKKEESKQDGQDKKTESKQDGQEKKDDQPAGGFDDTPIPSPSPGTVGYTLKFTMHQATNLAMGDAHAFSSDPYVLAQLNTDLPRRHKEDPRLRFRSTTVRKNTDPEWNEEWIVANVPSTGFKLKLRIYDEDPADHDDLLGKVHVTVPRIDDSWRGFKTASYDVKIRDSSKRAIIVRAVASCLGTVKHFRGQLIISIENLGRTGDDGQNGRVYTVGPCRWFRHYSPILGRLAGTKEPNETSEHKPSSGTESDSQKKIERYNFQSNQMQLAGPVPKELYHRFVEFKPWVGRMFRTSGFSGVILGKALHHQHARVYNFDRSTVWGDFPQGPCKEMTQKFLDLVHYDKGGRIYTYVLTLDALWSFTETGKEFGIDMLSKHTMHSDVSIYIAFSGEFFIRRLKKRRNMNSRTHTRTKSQEQSGENEPIETEDLQGPSQDDTEASTDPSHYELVIDNDSGTYRPNAKMLPLLAEYLAQSLPGLHVQTLDCQADADKMGKLKGEQRERKKKEGDHVVYTQASDSSSISSSDEEELNQIEHSYQGDGGQDSAAAGTGGSRRRKGEGRKTLQTAAKDVKMRHGGTVERWERNLGQRDRDSHAGKGALMEGQHEGAAAGASS